MKTTKKDKPVKPTKESAQSAPSRVVVSEGATVKDLTDLVKIKAKDLLDRLGKKGFSVGANDILGQNLITAVGQISGIEIEFLTLEEDIRRQATSQEKELVLRPPVVTIMGHVDHGKTTLLDAIRQSNLVDKESGGITQHIGAYRIIHKGRPITFIDTPGHEAFTQMRARGANVTDIVVLVVAADDGVMPQTREAIDHAKAAGVPILVAINKIDKAEADLDKTKQQLSKAGLLVESWGGDVISIDISAKEKKNLEELLEMILLLSDVTEIKANPKVPAQGVVLEARLDTQKGSVATVIIQHGILSQGQAFISGTAFGKARALFDENRKMIKKAEPSMPVEVLGFSDVATAGHSFQVVDDLDTAKRIAQFRLSQVKKEEPARPEHLTLDQLFQKIEEDAVKELSLIIKADVQGSVEVLVDILPNLSTEKVKLKITHAGTGNITESDILLASASDSIIIAYNIKPHPKIIPLAKEENVEIRSYNVIYMLTDDIKKAMTGLLEPTIKESYLGRAEVRRIFNIPRVGVIAGSYVLDGKIQRNAAVRVHRDEEVVAQDRIASLKHLKDNVTEVQKNYECGIGLEKFKDIQEGDIIEAFTTTKVKPE